MSENKISDHYLKLGRALNCPDSPNNLENLLLDNFDKQIAREKKQLGKKQLIYTIFATSIAASLFMVLISTLKVDMALPPVAEFAYEHVQNERTIVGHLDNDYKLWLSDKGLSVPVKSDSIVMSKNCLLAGIEAKHLRFELNDSKQNETNIVNVSGTIDLFIFPTDSQQNVTQKTSGEINDQKWVLFKHKNKTEVLVLYKSDHIKPQIDHIVKSILPDQEVVII